jgi:hypothetical protein
MMHANHLYETITLFLTGVAFGIYLYGLRRLYNRTHPPSMDRSARWTKAMKARKQTATRSV